MSEEKIKADGDEITQALEDARERYAPKARSQAEKSREAAMDEARMLLRKNPEMSTQEIVERTALTPRTVGQLMRQVKEAAAKEDGETAQPVAEIAQPVKRGRFRKSIGEIIDLYLNDISTNMEIYNFEITIDKDDGDVIMTVVARESKG